MLGVWGVPQLPDVVTSRIGRLGPARAGTKAGGWLDHVRALTAPGHFWRTRGVVSHD